jgi:glycosyltransferase involved in cell wall biosynthesis
MILFDKIKKIYKDERLNNYDVNVLFVNDGSKDGTLAEIKKLREENENVRYVSFVRNFGYEAALYAICENSCSDYLILINADCQDDENLIFDMVKGAEDGYDTVIAYQKNRRGSFIKKAYSSIFYRAINKEQKFSVRKDVREFRIMSRQLVDNILLLKERVRFSKVLLQWPAGKVKYLPMQLGARKHGESKFKFFTTLKYALLGIVSWTSAPLNLIWIICFFFMFCDVAFVTAFLVGNLCFNWGLDWFMCILSAVLLLFFVLTLFAVGAVGLYVKQIHENTKNRPLYIVGEKSE